MTQNKLKMVMLGSVALLSVSTASFASNPDAYFPAHIYCKSVGHCVMASRYFYFAKIPGTLAKKYDFGYATGGNGNALMAYYYDPTDTSKKASIIAGYNELQPDLTASGNAWQVAPGGTAVCKGTTLGDVQVCPFTNLPYTK